MKTTWLIALLCVCTICNGQTLINAHPVSGFQVSSDDIITFDVIHSSLETVNVQFQISVQQSAGEQQGKILEILSGIHSLQTGINNFNLSNFNIISKKYISSDIARYEQQMRSFPLGTYTYCIQIICKDEQGKCNDLFNSEINKASCTDFTILPMTPLLLSSPEDEAKLKEKRPNFSWIPPMPLGNNPDISYEMTLVHLNKDQRGEDGIRRNRPLHQQDKIPGVTLNFPTRLADLIPGERYAWQVKARIKDILVGTSDVWEFEIVEKKEAIKYVLLSKTGNAAVFNYLEQDSIFFTHTSEYPYQKFDLEIKQQSISSSISNVELDQKLLENIEVDEFEQDGQNTFKIGLGPYNLTEGIYQLILKQNNQTWKLNFKITEE